MVVDTRIEVFPFFGCLGEAHADVHRQFMGQLEDGLRVACGPK